MTKQVSVTITGTDAELVPLFAFLAGNRVVNVDETPIAAGHVVACDAADAVGDVDFAPAGGADLTDEEVAAIKKSKAAEKRKASDAKRKAAKAAAAEADLMDDGEKVTLDDVKGAVKAAIARADLDAVKGVFAEFKVAKMSDIKPADFAAVKTAVEAL